MEAHYGLGRAFQTLDRYAEAIAEFDAAIAIDPELVKAYSRRGGVFILMEDYAAALADFLVVVELAPEDSLGHYWLGYIQVQLGAYDAALASLSRALALDPDDDNALYERGRLFQRLDRHPEAISDFTAYLAIFPYEQWTIARRGESHELLGETAAAFHDYRLAQLIDPNYSRAVYGIQRLLPQGLPPATPSSPLYSTLGAALTIDYLQLTTTFVPRKEEMAEAIDKIAEWFKGPPKQPVPSEYFFLRWNAEPAAGDETHVSSLLPFPDIDRATAGAVERSTSFHYALWPGEMGGQKDLPPLTVLYGQSPLADLWQLQPGESLKGRAKLVLICPDSAATKDASPMVVAVGCGEGVERVPIGSLTWAGTFEAWESILVPAGIFSTARISGVVTAELHLFGATVTQEIAITWWYAPTLGWWVRRHQRQPDTDEIQILEAVAIAPT